jgi:hypothetical protein
MPMTGTYPVQVWGIHCRSGERRQTRRNSIGSIEELYNEIEKSVQAGFQKKTLSVLKLEIWMKKL